MSSYEGNGGAGYDSPSVRQHTEEGDSEDGAYWHRQHDSHVSERDRRKSRDSHRDKEREKDHHHQDHHRDRGERDDRSRRDKDRDRDRDRNRDRDRDRDRERHRSRDYDRHQDYDYDSERRHSHQSHSHSRSSRDRSRSRSRSRSKSKRVSGFDMAPPGAAVMAGANVAGQIPGMSQPMPGMFPNIFPFGGTQFGTLPVMPGQAMTQQATRHARRVYVGSLPPMANEQSIATFFSQVMTAIGGNTAGPGDAVVNVYINHEKKFAFVEMRTVEEASNAMALDGIIFEGVPVRVRRPSDYNPSLAAALGPSQPSPHLNLAAVGLTPGAAGVADGPDRVFVGGLPYYLTETQIRELLESFGPLRGFDLVKDRDTGNSKGYGFCVYQDPAVTDIACAALNGLKMGDKTLTVRRATASSTQARPDQANVLAQAQQHIALQKLVLQAGNTMLPGIPGLLPGMTGESGTADTPTHVVCLTQVVSADELLDDEEFEEILEDMREECGKYGTIVNLVIPRPSTSGEFVAGVGKVFVQFSDTQSSEKAKFALSGRKFGGNTVVAVYYPEDKFRRGEYDG
ncbi:splicing factor U2af large subunit B isoform X2 [Cryptomeria japonica]|uniref:splicing factor U2af large subunit B isoform X2 n=1 Tax=Cryptomeria japonica TaxID=3369 RepID=UPI0027DA60C7|nr:splicing factor U2af large subunit B isoform X2 [Cryptomeria japonica]